MFNIFREEMVIKQKMSEMKEMVERNQAESFSLQPILSKFISKKSKIEPACCNNCCPAVS
jgi:formylmethanofuran dehydrogenase subunit E